MVAHPSECATSAGGAEQPAMAASRAAIQSSRLGKSQFFCWTRRYSGWSRSHSDCQCCGPEFNHPGRMRTGTFIVQDCNSGVSGLLDRRAAPLETADEVPNCERFAPGITLDG